MDVITQSFVLQQLERTLDAHVLNQNTNDRLVSYPPYIEVLPMREINNLASALSSTIASLKQSTVNAQTRFQNEVSNSNANIAKVNAFTDDLASANKQVEAMLVDTGSNFPNASVAPVAAAAPVTADKNGVVTPKG